MSAEAGDSLGVQLVEAAGSGAVIGHQASVFEYAQVLGHGGTAHRKLTRQLVDGDGTGGELSKDGRRWSPNGIESGL